MGWDVVATDLPDVVSSVLSGNISRNLSQLPVGSGSIQVRILDWTVLPERWTWNDDATISSSTSAISNPTLSKDDDGTAHLTPPFDLIVTADTLYSASLVEPLLRTLHHLCVFSQDNSILKRSPPVYLCVERRDTRLTDRTLKEAEEVWKFAVQRIPHKKVVKAMEKGGLKWKIHEWEGVEIWKLVLRHT